MNLKRQTILIFLFVPCLIRVYGQVLPADSLAKYYDMSLEELQTLKVKSNSSELEKIINTLLSVASEKALSSRESPSIVSVITEEDIHKSGARDLIDVLHTVPGFDFAYDGNSTVGIGARGNWANEGKILLLIDGQQVNEIFSGVLSFGNRYPLSAVTRIEIIRGPGSALYGGFAELGVINVITKTGDQLKGIHVEGSYGQMKDTYGRRNIQLNAGGKWKETLVSFSGMVGQGQRSDQESFASSQRDFERTKTGRTLSLAGRSDADPLFLNFKVAHRGFTFKALYDGYRSANLDLVDTNSGNYLTTSNRSINVDALQEIKLSSRFTISPRVQIISQTPNVKGGPDSLDISQNYGTRIGLSVGGNYRYSRKLAMAGGVQFYRDRGTNSSDSILTINSYVSSIDYTNWAGYLQLTAKTQLVNFILGGRYDHNSNYGDAFVPRVALTRRLNKLHFKALYSSAFRAPTISNIARGIKNISTLEPGIKAEKTTVIELETGYQITKNSILSLNVYQSTIKDPIVNLGAVSLYTNYDRAGSKGLETEFQYKNARWYFTAGYSFYTVANKKKVDIYSLREFTSTDSVAPTGHLRRSDVLLGFPAHKLTAKVTFSINREFSVSTTLVYNSKRYGYDAGKTGEDDTYTFNLTKYNSNCLAHVFLNYDNVIKGLNIGIGLYNVLNDGFVYATPYYAGAGALPSQSRELLMKVSYKIDLQ